MRRSSTPRPGGWTPSDSGGAPLNTLRRRISPSPWWGTPLRWPRVERRSRSGFRRRRARGDPGMGRLPRLGSPRRRRRVARHPRRLPGPGRRRASTVRDLQPGGRIRRVLGGPFGRRWKPASAEEAGERACGVGRWDRPPAGPLGTFKFRRKLASNPDCDWSQSVSEARHPSFLTVKRRGLGPRRSLRHRGSPSGDSGARSATQRLAS